jgi:hypothetical protein
LDRKWTNIIIWPRDRASISVEQLRIIKTLIINPYRNTQGRGDTLAPRDGSNYFEKICLRGEISGCRDKAWAFERMPGWELEGHNTKELKNIPSRRDCEEYCLRERGFPCRSAEYNSASLDCVLSRETRRTRPAAFRETRNVDYLENGCISTSKFLKTF